MRRRDFMAGLVGAVFGRPMCTAAAAPARQKRIGVLMEYAEGDPEVQARVSALGEGLRSFGWITGSNLHLDYRYAAGDPERIRAFATELVGLAPDLILGSGAPVTLALKQATRTVPIVFVQIPDPVGAGLVPSLVRPGGNITGFINFEYTIVGKWLEMLKEIVPSLAVVLLLQNPTHFGWPSYLKAMETAAASFRVSFIPGPAHDAAEIERTVASFAQHHNGGMIVLPHTMTSVHRKLSVGLADQHRLPAVYPFRFFVTAGGLISYGLDTHAVFRRASAYVDRILRGEEPGNLPIQTATEFQLVINRSTAKTLGLTIPPLMLARADEVIE